LSVISYESRESIGNAQAEMLAAAIGGVAIAAPLAAWGNPAGVAEPSTVADDERPEHGRSSVI
jgi:hypothetical protein